MKDDFYTLQQLKVPVNTNLNLILKGTENEQ